MKSQYCLSMVVKDKNKLLSFVSTLRYRGKYAFQRSFNLQYYVAARTKRYVYLINLFFYKERIAKHYYRSRTAVNRAKRLGIKAEVGP